MPNSISKSDFTFRFSSVVEEAPVAKLPPPARGLLLGRGAGMLKVNFNVRKDLLYLLGIPRYHGVK